MHMAKKQRENICKMKSKGDKGMDVMVEIKNLSKTYDGKNMVLDKFSYIFDKGRFYAIMGRSGAGKSTLLNIIGTIDCITEGEVLVAGKNVTGLKKRKRQNYEKKILDLCFRDFI